MCLSCDIKLLYVPMFKLYSHCIFLIYLFIFYFVLTDLDALPLLHPLSHLLLVDPNLNLLMIRLEKTAFDKSHCFGFTGKLGIHLPHHLLYRVFLEDCCLWISLSCRCLLKKLLEHSGLCLCICWVS